MPDPYDDPAWHDFVQQFRLDALQKISGSHTVLSLMPRDGLDVKYCAELGAAIMCDKPIIVVVPNGVKPPAHLVRVADQIIRADVDTEDGRRKIAEALKRTLQ